MTVQHLLENEELRLVIESGAYQIEYYSSALPKTSPNPGKVIRNYRLIDVIRRGTMVECWGTFAVASQTTIVFNLLDYCNYRVTSVFSGWEAKCPACGNVTRGKIWESPPQTCQMGAPRKCRAEIPSSSVRDVPANW